MGWRRETLERERRKPYYGSAAVDPTCRPHGSCPYCKTRRTHKHRKRLVGATEAVLEAVLENDGIGSGEVEA